MEMIAKCATPSNKFFQKYAKKENISHNSNKDSEVQRIINDYG